MAYADLHAFIARLEAAGELIRVREPVSARWEITEIADRVSKGAPARNKALLFENVQGAQMPVLINALGSERRMAWALGVETLDELRANLARLLDPKPPQGLRAGLRRGREMLGALRSVGLRPRRVRRAPCQQVVITENPSLDALPILTCWPDDGGPFITLPQVITRDPRTGQRNVGMYRLQKYDARTLGMHWQRHKGGADHEREARAQGLHRIPCAIVLGGDPAQMWAASAPLPPNMDEYMLAGWLRGKPVPFVRAVTQPLDVPANAEIVLEGYVDITDQRTEGPFGDHTGYYTPQDLFPTFHLTAITHRRDAIYPTTVVGKPPMEDYWMGKATERLFLPLFQLFQPEVQDYAMPAEGVFHNLLILSMTPRYPGHAQKVIYGVWSTGLMMLTKAVIVVDADVDVHDPVAVADAVLTNVDWRRDVTRVTGAVDQLDHAAIWDSYGGKIGVDATRKPNRPAHAFAPLDVDALTARIGASWHSPRAGLVLLGVEKSARSVRETLAALWSVAPDWNAVALDADVDLRDLREVAWRALGDVDWWRDAVFHPAPPDPFAPLDKPRGAIGLDATTKGTADGHLRGWPQPVRMSDEVRRLVSEKWARYGLE